MPKRKNKSDGKKPGRRPQAESHGDPAHGEPAAPRLRSENDENTPHGKGPGAADESQTTAGRPQASEPPEVDARPIQEESPTGDIEQEQLAEKTAEAAKERTEVSEAAQAEAQKSAEGESEAQTARGGRGDEQLGFPIVAIGASAGGLQALQEFFAHVDPEVGMAFVVVTHLERRRKTQLSQLLAQQTTMRVAEAADGDKLEPNHVYTIPPGVDLGLLKGKIQILPTPDGDTPSNPINIFLRSLAQDQGDNAAAVILSGMGTDGTSGVVAVKAELGLVVMQTPDSAAFSSMPESAINTGLVDYITPPAEMPTRLTEYFHRGGRHRRFPLQPLDRNTAMALEKICYLVRTTTGHDFSVYKHTTLRRRIERRMLVHGMDELPDYVRYLQENKQEASALFREILIGVTGFFRDPEAWTALKKQLDDAIRGMEPGFTFRAWVPGCSTGEEAYSIGILLQEIMAETDQRFEVQVFATDADERAVEMSRAGLYPAATVEGMPAQRRNRYFTREGGDYRIARRVRETVIFAPQNVIKDPPFTRLDLVSCRNLLIYLEAEVQRKLIPLFHHCLRDRGLLFLGSSETIGDHSDLFQSLDTKWKIFRRRDGVATRLFLPELPLPGARQPAEQRTAGKPVDLGQTIDRLLLTEYAPPAVVISDRGDIIYISGRTGRYLEPAEGLANMNIFEMARPGLKLHIATCLRNAKQEQVTVRHRQVRVESNGGTSYVDVTVKPLTGVPGGEGLYRVLFEPVGAPELKDAEEGPVTETDARDEQIRRLETELQHARENLRTMVEELESTNEELQSANEEYQSNNEELQSANEELESSREEMQSLNEELTTVNDELREKIQSLSTSQRTMEHLLNALSIPLVFIDREMRIRRFTEPVRELINLIPTDVGRPLSDISTNLSYSSIDQDVQSVLDTLQTRDVEVRTRGGRAYLMRIIPHRGGEAELEGVVVRFVDVHELRRAQKDLSASESDRRFAEAILASVQQPLLVVDADLRVRSANKAFFRLFKMGRDEVEGRHLYEVGHGQWAIPTLRRLLENVLPNQDTIEDYEMEADFTAVGRLRLRLSARPLVDSDSDIQHILIMMDNATQQERGHEQQG